MQSNWQKYSYLLLAFVAFSFMSCDDNLIYEEHRPMDNNVWNSEDIKEFSFDVIDTLSYVNIFVKLRTTTDYPFSNLYVFLYSEYPDGSLEKDTMDFGLAETDGKWLGDNTGTLVSFVGLVSSGGKFRQPGKYTFRLQHAMREKDLPEIVDIGIRVERMEIKKLD